MDTSQLPYGKPRPRKLEKADRTKQRVSVDSRESAKVKARSGGQCEVRWFGATGQVEYRCQRRAGHVHPMLGGIGVRGRGESALAKNKLNVCDVHHSEIHAHVLVRDGVRWRKVK